MHAQGKEAPEAGASHRHPPPVVALRSGLPSGPRSGSWRAVSPKTRSSIQFLDVHDQPAAEIASASVSMSRCRRLLDRRIRSADRAGCDVAAPRPPRRARTRHARWLTSRPEPPTRLHGDLHRQDPAPSRPERHDVSAGRRPPQRRGALQVDTATQSPDHRGSGTLRRACPGTS